MLLLLRGDFIITQAATVRAKTSGIYCIIYVIFYYLLFVIDYISVPLKYTLILFCIVLSTRSSS